MSGSSPDRRPLSACQAADRLGRRSSGSCWTPCAATSPCSHRTPRSNACGKSPPRCWRTRPQSSHTPLAPGARSQQSATSPRPTIGTCPAPAHPHETSKRRSLSAGNRFQAKRRTEWGVLDGFASATTPGIARTDSAGICRLLNIPRRGRESAAVRTLRAAAGGFLDRGPGGGIGGSPCAYVLPPSSETAAAIRHAAMAKSKAAARPPCRAARSPPAGWRTP
jgi:hypothetical protein